ncbi:MAG: hypothetical protein ACRBCT_07020 [Alphaproteobacteria bacterium]
MKIAYKPCKNNVCTTAQDDSYCAQILAVNVLIYRFQVVKMTLGLNGRVGQIQIAWKAASEGSGGGVQQQEQQQQQQQQQGRDPVLEELKKQQQMAQQHQM